MTPGAKLAKAIRLLLSSGMLACPIAPATALSTGKMDASDLPSSVACRPDRASVQLDENVSLKAWAKGPPHHQLSYVWTTTVGSIRGQGGAVNWDSTGLPAGIYKSQVRVYDNALFLGECLLRVVVLEQERGTEAARETGRAFLVRGKAESGRYGLYSYLLFGSRPTDTTRDRYLKAVSAYLRSIEDVSRLEGAGFAPDRLNITYFPISSTPEQVIDSPWLLDHYDFAKARLLLDSLGGERRNGIYLVSSLKPILGEAAGPVLVQDLSTVPTSPDDLIGWWVEEFLEQAAQEHFWEPRTTTMLALKMRTTIAVLAAGLPEVERALDSWITRIR